MVIYQTLHSYFRVHGSYEALDGGFATEAMEDFTGGVSERFKLQKLPEGIDLFKTMDRAHRKGSLMGLVRSFEKKLPPLFTRISPVFLLRFEQTM